MKYKATTRTLSTDQLLWRKDKLVPNYHKNKMPYSVVQRNYNFQLYNLKTYIHERLLLKISDIKEYAML